VRSWFIIETIKDKRGHLAALVCHSRESAPPHFSRHGSVLARVKLLTGCGLNKMKKKNIKAENRTQAEAFRRMKGNVLELIPRYAANFRQIITEFESENQGRVPSADELLWIASEREGRDITR
jgi:hypothetical protein